jgi:hypothetical protein
MGMFSDRLRADVQGHVIEIECRVIEFKVPPTAEWRLIVDNKLADSVQGKLGSFTLRAVTSRDQQPITALITQGVGVLPTRYKLFVSGRKVSLKRLDKWYEF